MDNYGCELCKDLCLEWKIVTPGDTKKAMGIINDNLKDGTLIESPYWPKTVLRIERKRFEELSEKESWPDIMAYYFQCSKCDQLFSLAVETYHGMSGEWKPIHNR
jgi:hypothetical protein